MTRRRHQNQSGTSLLEVLVYVVILTTILNMSLSLFLTAKRLSHRGGRAIDRIETVEAISHEFRKIVHTSSGVSPGSDPGTNRLTLEGATAAGDPTRHILSFDSDSKKFRMASMEKVGDRYVATSVKTFDRGLEDVQFEVLPGGSAGTQLISLSLTIENAGLINTLPTVQTFTASPRQHLPGSVSRDRSGT